MSSSNVCVAKTLERHYGIRTQYARQIRDFRRDLAVASKLLRAFLQNYHLGFLFWSCTKTSAIHVVTCEYQATQKGTLIVETRKNDFWHNRDIRVTGIRATKWPFHGEYLN